MLPIQRLSTVDADFLSRLKTLLAFEAAADENIERTVANILADVKTRGDAAVIDYTNKFDRLSAKAMLDLELRKDELQAALDGLPAERRAAQAAGSDSSASRAAAHCGSRPASRDAVAAAGIRSIRALPPGRQTRWSVCRCS